MKKSKSPEEIIISSMQTSKEKLLDKQEAYRAILDGPSIDKTIAESTLSTLGWETFLEQMDEYYFPIDQKSINKYLVNPKQFKTRTELRIEKIENLKIQHHLYFLNLINEHTQRLNVIAHLHQQFGDSDSYNLIFIHWLRYSQCTMILKEIHQRSELFADDDGVTLLETDAFVSELILTAFIGLKLPDIEPSTIENM